MTVDRVTNKTNIDKANMDMTSSEMGGLMGVARGKDEVNGFWKQSESYTKTQKVSESKTINMADTVYFKPDGKKSTGASQAGSVVDQLEADGQKTAENRLNQMIVLSNTTSAEDYKEMQENGFSMADTDAATIITETDMIKAVLAEAGVDISVYGDGLSEEQLEEITGSKALATSIINKLKEKDLSVSKENVSQANEAIEKATSIDSISDGSMAYLIRNNLEPTIENIYKAANSNQQLTENREKLSDSDFEDLKSQLENVITESGEQINEQSLSRCKWLIENRLEITPDNMEYLRKLQELNSELNTANEGQAYVESVVSSIVDAIAEGKRPINAMMLEGYSLHDKAKKAIEIVENAIPEDIAKLIEQNKPVTIQNLGFAEAARENSKINVMNVSVEIEITSITVITAHRKLEEARLSMSFQANLSLLKKGITIDTKPIEQLVEALKEQENSYYRDMMNQAEIEASAKNIDSFKNTLNVFDELKNIPASILGKNISSSTINEIYETGITIKASYEKASQSYETLMTAPRADLGDNIRKAFQNVDDILEDLGLDISKENQRAVRILAYNEIEINTDNIFEIKAKDEEVQRAFKNMTPAVTLEMIRKGISPLDMTITQLNEVAEEIKKTTEDGAEKFSEYLWKLEKNNQISEDERESYIGIYRLIAQVEKTDGAVVGSLVNQGAELTMKNLLSAVRSSSKGQMDYKVDDDFEGVSSKSQGKRIDDQIRSAYNTNCIHDIYDELTPQKVKEILDSEGSKNWEELTIEEFKEVIEQVNEDAKADLAYIQDQMAELEDAANTGKNVYEFMERFDIKNSIMNIKAAKRMLNDPGQMIEELWSNGKYGMLRGLKEQVLERFGEAVKTPQELADAQETLAETAEHVMDNMIIEDRKVTSVDIKEMKLLNAQFQIASKMAKEENYVIPVETGDSVTGVALKIIRGKEKKGLVDIFFDNKNMGKVAASFEAKENGVAGVIAVSSEKMQKAIVENMSAFTDKISDTSPDMDNLKVVLIPELSSEQFETSSLHKELRVNKDIDNDSDNKGIQTKMLYNIAESFITSIKTFVD